MRISFNLQLRMSLRKDFPQLQRLSTVVSNRLCAKTVSLCAQKIGGFKFRGFFLHV
jgi:hypothetical protein